MFVGGGWVTLVVAYGGGVLVVTAAPTAVLGLGSCKKGVVGDEPFKKNRKSRTTTPQLKTCAVCAFAPVLVAVMVLEPPKMSSAPRTLPADFDGSGSWHAAGAVPRAVR